MRPKNYKRAFASLNKPTLIILGENDAAGGARSQDFAREIKLLSKAKVIILENEHHHV